VPRGTGEKKPYDESQYIYFLCPRRRNWAFIPRGRGNDRKKRGEEDRFSLRITEGLPTEEKGQEPSCELPINGGTFTVLFRRGRFEEGKRELQASAACVGQKKGRSINPAFLSRSVSIWGKKKTSCAKRRKRRISVPIFRKIARRKKGTARTTIRKKSTPCSEEGGGRDRSYRISGKKASPFRRKKKSSLQIPRLSKKDRGPLRCAGRGSSFRWSTLEKKTPQNPKPETRGAEITAISRKKKKIGLLYHKCRAQQEKELPYLLSPAGHQLNRQGFVKRGRRRPFLIYRKSCVSFARKGGENLPS